MSAEIAFYYRVRRANTDDAMGAIRALEAFVRTPGGRVRLEGSDRVVVWRDGAVLYVSPGAFSLAGYLDPDPDAPRADALCGPEITPSRTYPGPAMIAETSVPAADLPATCELLLGTP